ncbi:uncharacterized protein LOC111268137 [Varroa jacobsoni]|uniref:Single domain-containing protein n=1 Tax=Varroa destructor TaxID=109461 RepID=A0A7M7JXK8_VARDE|nr:uncharacterized protein LOC111249253 [Varroa destructor]XP_022702636.1 uncharacterized protein LOC111268137 [Varroa jacobsoni]
MLKLVESLIVALVTVGNIEDIQSSSARSLSYSYYPNVKTKMDKCVHPIYAVLFTGDYYPKGLCERHRCFINAGGQGHLEVTGCPPPQIRGCWPLSNETQPYPRCCKHVMVCVQGAMDHGDHGSFSVVEASPGDLKPRPYRRPRKGLISHYCK